MGIFTDTIDYWFMYDDPELLVLARWIVMRFLYTWWILYGVTAMASGLIMGAFTGYNCTAIMVSTGSLYYNMKKTYEHLPRMLTCTLLHFDAVHVFMNSLATYNAFVCLTHQNVEPWLLLMFPIVLFCGALNGSVMSYHGHLKIHTCTVGASGGVCAVGAYGILAPVFLRRWIADPYFTASDVVNFLVLIYQCTPLASLASSVAVDFWSHCGGVVVGAAAILVTWLMGNFYSVETRIRVCGTLLTLIAAAYLWSIISVIRQTRNNGRERLHDLRIQFARLDSIVIKDNTLLNKYNSGHYSVSEDKLLQERYNKNAATFAPGRSKDERDRRVEFNHWNKDNYDDKLTTYYQRRSSAPFLG